MELAAQSAARAPEHACPIDVFFETLRISCVAWMSDAPLDDVWLSSKCPIGRLRFCFSPCGQTHKIFRQNARAFGFPPLGIGPGCSVFRPSLIAMVVECGACCLSSLSSGS